MQIQALLLDNSTGPWHKIYQEGSLKTWCTRLSNSSNTILYRGQDPKLKLLNTLLNRILIRNSIHKYWPRIQVRNNSSQVKCLLSEGELEVAIPELWPNITLKTLTAIRFIHEFKDYEILVRANASCYLNISALEKYLNENPSEFLYGGPKLESKKFISGWGIIMNRSVIEILLRNENLQYLKYYDDEAIGLILNEEGISPQPIPFLAIESISQLLTINIEVLKSTPLIRVKSFQRGTRCDHKIMKLIHQMIGES